MNMTSWQQVLAAAVHLQRLLPDAVLVGGTAAATHASHRVSFDDDHVLSDLRERFDEILDHLEQADGWVTARVNRPVLILGSLDGIETGVRQLVRRRPLEVEEGETPGGTRQRRSPWDSTSSTRTRSALVDAGSRRSWRSSSPTRLRTTSPTSIFAPTGSWSLPGATGARWSRRATGWDGGCWTSSQGSLRDAPSTPRRRAGHARRRARACGAR